MRRRFFLVAFAAALTLSTTAYAGLERVQPRAHELAVPTVRAGTVQIPPRQRTGRVRVIATLRLPPLAAARGATFSFAGSPERLDLRSFASRSYLAHVEQAQRAAIATLRREIPAARVSRRYAVVLDGLAIDLPARRLPALRRLAFVNRIYPSLQYTLRLNRSPSAIGATAFHAVTGIRGDGIKIAVVDDGIDSSHRFFDPAGFAFPPGYPKGGKKWTTPKVIVARAYPGPGSGRRGRLPVDPDESFHATHVAGIAAGIEGTDAPNGRDHPFTPGLSGVAPRAYLGNYRVFNAPTPVGNVANTPEIVAAFEDAVRDGMDVVNFSGGGPQVDPVNDAMYEAVENTVAAGVVAVVSAGNDRGEFGLGSAGTPGTAPEAISVAAVSNAQVFAPSLSATAPSAPASLKQVPFLPAAGLATPRAWLSGDQTLIDVGSLVGRNGQPVDRKLCGTGRDPNAATTPLTGRPLAGAIVLVFRGECTFVSKAARAGAAGAVGMVVVDNRSGEANPIPIPLGIPAGMISDLDGAQLRDYTTATGGRTTIRVGRQWDRIETGRSGVVTSFSSGGPTAFEHALKPDVAAPGGAILSSTLRSFGGPFAAFDGTSMAAPHVTGAVALLLQRHPGWSPRQVKSALVSTAGPAWADTARTSEAPVVLQGGGLVSVPAADNPLVFTDPASLSFGDLKTTGGAVRRSLLLSIQDAGGGAGTWAVELHAQSTSPGAGLDLPPVVVVPPGGSAEVGVSARASAEGETGDNYGFIVLRQGAVARRIPYAFFVSRPALALHDARPLKRIQVGTTRFGASRVERYRFPNAPFGPHPTYFGPPMDEDGAERVYTTQIAEPVVNFGAAVVSTTPGALVDPWLLGSLDENDVEGYAATPVNVNSFTLNYQLDVGAAGAVFPRPKRYFFSVDSPRHPFTGRLLAGRYVLRSWVDDVLPPSVDLVTNRVAAGRPTIVVRARDFSLFPRRMSGVDPTSLVLAYRRVLVGASAYDPSSGLAIFLLPREAPRIRAGRTRAILVAADYQEAKNVTTPGGEVLPNTAFRPVTIRAVRGAAATWLDPRPRACVSRRARLVVAVSATRRIRAVRFLVGNRRIKTVRRGTAGLYTTTWNTSRLRRGKYLLRAVVIANRGQRANAERVARICRRR
ncbi:MAG: S8 family serine peptidase [Thermoleophilia bacterium]|nr:S8 family serine peptidase [Thermoleophilia bacterium]